MLKDGPRGVAVPKAWAHQPGGTWSHAQVVVGAQGGPAEGNSPQWLGTLARVGRGVLLRWWSLLKEGLRGAAVPKARAHKPRGTGSPVQLVVGAQGGPAGGSSPQGPGTLAQVGRGSGLGSGRCSRRAYGGQQSPRPGHTSLGGRGVLPSWWSVLKEGLRGAAVPKARAHKPRGTGSPA